MTADEVDRTFFDREVDAVARDLIGRRLRVTGADGALLAMIVETEAYGDASDPASHAALPGGRAALMRAAAGAVYVYSAYGMYPCMNIVTGAEGQAGAVLLRGVWLDGEDSPVFGPGRTTRLLGVTADDHGEFVPGQRFGVTSHKRQFGIASGPRIGITRAVDTPWRFVAQFESVHSGK